MPVLIMDMSRTSTWFGGFAAFNSYPVLRRSGEREGSGCRGSMDKAVVVSLMRQGNTTAFQTHYETCWCSAMQSSYQNQVRFSIIRSSGHRRGSVSGLFDLLSLGLRFRRLQKRVFDQYWHWEIVHRVRLRVTQCTVIPKVHVTSLNAKNVAISIVS